MPGKIVVTQYASIDGVIEDPVGMENSGLGDWTGPFKRGPRGDAFKHDELVNAAAMIYGRKTYDGFAAVWPHVNDPQGFAARINSLPKYVASRTLAKAEWQNSSLISGNIVDAAKRLKAAVDGDILIYGSASIVHQLLPHELIDEIRLMIFPVLLGRGKRWFADGYSASFQLAESIAFDDGIVLSRYVSSQP